MSSKTERFVYVPWILRDHYGLRTTSGATEDQLYRFGEFLSKGQVLSFTGLGMPPVRYNTSRGPCQDGETFTDFRYNPRIYTVTFRESGQCRDDYWRVRHKLVNTFQNAEALTFSKLDSVAGTYSGGGTPIRNEDSGPGEIPITVTPNSVIAGVSDLVLDQLRFGEGSMGSGEILIYNGTGNVYAIDARYLDGLVFNPRDVDGEYAEHAIEETVSFIAHDPIIRRFPHVEVVTESAYTGTTGDLTFGSLPYNGSYRSYPILKITSRVGYGGGITSQPIPSSTANWEPIIIRGRHYPDFNPTGAGVTADDYLTDRFEMRINYILNSNDAIYIDTNPEAPHAFVATNEESVTFDSATAVTDISGYIEFTLGTYADMFVSNPGLGYEYQLGMKPARPNLNAGNQPASADRQVLTALYYEKEIGI